jgi:hypothetical protein
MNSENLSRENATSESHSRSHNKTGA